MNALQTPASPTAANDRSLLGLARLMTMAFRGQDLSPLANEMIRRASTDENDANAWMDLSTILMLQGATEVGLTTQAQALAIRREYELAPVRRPAVRLLALMTPGDLMTNAPLPFLIEDSDIALTCLYLSPGEPFPNELPEHDLLYVAISQSEATEALLREIDARIDAGGKAVLNRPARIALTDRSCAFSRIDGCPGLLMMPTARATRAQVRALGAGEFGPSRLVAGGEYPLIIRPIDSHAGHGLEKLDSPADVATYLRGCVDDAFFVSRFVDYSDADGLYRKYRVVLVRGRPYAGHMGISEHWMVHYLNAGMNDSAAKRAEEAAFMRDFDTGFAVRHREALDAIARAFELDYLVVDCAQARTGELLVFEVDPGAVVHSMDPVDLFPYKPVHMKKVYAAFRAMLLESSRSSN